jgi:hypothetical protein
MPLRTLRTAPLKFGFDSFHTVRSLIHVFSFVCRPIRVHSKVHDAEVHAESTNGIVLTGFWRVNYDHNKASASSRLLVAE